MRNTKKQTVLFSFTWILMLFAATCSWTSAHAQAIECKHKGEIVDLDDSDVKAFIEGEVTCVRTFSDGAKSTERKVLSKGKVLEEETIRKDRHELRRYKIVNGNGLRHGEQLEFYPGTKVLKERERTVDGNKVGLQETFFENGKIKSKEFYAKIDDSRGAPGQVASIRYTADGKVASLRCSQSVETTIDPALCGYSGAKEVELYRDDGALRSKVKMANGKILESEEDAAPTSRWASVLTRGAVDEPKAAKRKRENRANGSSTFTDLYQNGKIKRRMEVDEKGMLAGTDEEWYESGQKARSTTYGREKSNVGSRANGELTVEQSVCWWQNGKPKIEVKKAKSNSLFEINTYWDNGTLATKGSIKTRTDCTYCMEVSAVEFLVECEPGYGYGFKREGTHFEWDRDGQPLSEVNYRDGELQGIHKVYLRPIGAPASYLLEERTYEKGKLAKMIRYENGKVLKTEEYFPDGSIK
jgi:antitoxin component YwqK of YwqJK toxin-antitoxin module